MHRGHFFKRHSSLCVLALVDLDQFLKSQKNLRNCILRNERYECMYEYVKILLYQKKNCISLVEDFFLVDPPRFPVHFIITLRKLSTFLNPLVIYFFLKFWHTLWNSNDFPWISSTGRLRIFSGKAHFIYNAFRLMSFQ